ncbi:MAG: thiamine pyrophosphate-binding protein [Longimicrobiales bacterium]
MSSPTETLRALAAARITHVVGIPDNTSAPLFDALGDHPSITLVTATREGEAIAVAAGLWLGGAAPLIVIQNTGLLESGDSLRGTASRMGAAVPMLITGRGYAKMAKAGITPDEPRTRAFLTRPDVDTTAPLTEPTLDAWGIPFERCEEEEYAAATILRAIESARTEERPTAAIIACPLN